jgi:predicted patatin/cPLA2 family phospholipase
MESIPKIHFILPAGGVRGAFQAGFLYQLFTKYREHFEIARIDGTSVGALNGYTTICNKLEDLKEIWLSLNSIEDLFNNWSDSYLFGSLQCYYHSYYNCGLYSNSKFKSRISEIGKDWDAFPQEHKDKYSCVVVCLETGSAEYINGSQESLVDYITASASPWILSNPNIIDNKTYTDGALIEGYPIKHVNKCGADLTVIVGYDQEHFKYLPCTNDNILSYLAALIDIAKVHSVNIHDTKKIIDNTSTNNVVAISNPMNILLTDFNKEAIHEGFQSGVDFANTFFKTYLQNRSNNTENNI